MRTWSWAKFKPPVCARVDGRLHVLDGQHTAIAAASHGGIPTIPVVVVAAPDIVDRAGAFVSHATDRLITTPTQIWRAAVQAGDEDALTVWNVCQRAGVELLPFSPAGLAYLPGQTVALAAIRRLIDRRGAMRARQVLEALAKAGLSPITGDHIKVGEALLCDPDYAGEFDAERVTTSMRALKARSYAEARELSIAKHIPAWRALTSVIYRGRTRSSKGGDPIRSVGCTGGHRSRCCFRPKEVAPMTSPDLEPSVVTNGAERRPPELFTAARSSRSDLILGIDIGAHGAAALLNEGGDLLCGRGSAGAGRGPRRAPGDQPALICRDREALGPSSSLGRAYRAEARRPSCRRLCVRGVEGHGRSRLGDPRRAVPDDHAGDLEAWCFDPARSGNEGSRPKPSDRTVAGACRPLRPEARPRPGRGGAHRMGRASA